MFNFKVFNITVIKYTEKTCVNISRNVYENFPSYLVDLLFDDKNTILDKIFGEKLFPSPFPPISMLLEDV